MYFLTSLSLSGPSSSSCRRWLLKCVIPSGPVCRVCSSGDLVGRLCKHSVTGSTHVSLQKHQSHTEPVKDTAPLAQWQRTCGIAFKCNQSRAKNPNRRMKRTPSLVHFSSTCHIWKATRVLGGSKHDPRLGRWTGRVLLLLETEPTDLVLKRRKTYWWKTLTFLTLTWDKVLCRSLKSTIIVHKLETLPKTSSLFCQCFNTTYSETPKKNGAKTEPFAGALYLNVWSF